MFLVNVCLSFCVCASFSFYFLRGGGGYELYLFLIIAFLFIFQAFSLFIDIFHNDTCVKYIRTNSNLRVLHVNQYWRLSDQKHILQLRYIRSVCFKCFHTLMAYFRSDTGVKCIRTNSNVRVLN